VNIHSSGGERREFAAFLLNKLYTEQGILIELTANI
jgi:hypothetical protein